MRPPAIAELAIPTLVLVGTLRIHVCAYGAGMGAAYRSCECAGVEWELYERTPADGPRKTVCLGILRATTCYANMGGLEVDCPPP